MKTLICRLAAILSVALCSGILASGTHDWDEAKDNPVIGTVVASGTNEYDLAIHTGKGNFEIANEDDFNLKVGEKVRVYWYHCGSGRAGFRHCAKKIERVGNAKGAQKKR